MTTKAKALILAAAVSACCGGEVRAGKVSAEVKVRAVIFNQEDRQHVGAIFTGRGIHSPSMESGWLNGSASSLKGTRAPGGSVLGSYPVLIKAQVRAAGSSTSRMFRTTVTLRRRMIVVGGMANIKLARPVNPNRPGRQSVQGSGRLTVRTPF